jgi:hypothetical protein
MLYAQEAIGMVDEAEVHPDGPWPEAKTATVKCGEGTYTRVPIIRITMTPANLTVRKEEYPTGAVLLNEIPPPENQEPILLPAQQPTGDIPVDVQRNAGWPSGSVVLFTEQMSMK